MQVFVPYKEPLKVAIIMWSDKKRFNKQIIECRQILNAIEGVGKGWFNHPVVKMYKDHKEWLECYLKVFEFYKNIHNDELSEYDKYYVNNDLELYNKRANEITPLFLTDDFCYQHKRRLYTKSPELYSLFAKYGKSDINYYYVDGELLKYKNGKRIKE